jgi:ABC-type multidrug transport system ATPase subunit
MIFAENISKSYKSKTEEVKALLSINLDIPKGEMFGVIGPDGAGKTSLFRILTTLLLADSGTASINGLDIVKEYAKIRQQIGYMPGRFSLYQDLTVEENLQFFATIFNTSIEENYSLIKDIYEQIAPFKDRRAGQLSGGMKQKLALSCALIHRPEVLFLDEPTTGVDAVSRKEFWQMLQKLKGDGLTILVSTPYMDEAEQCDRIALIQEGKILMNNSPEKVKSSFSDPLFAIRTNKMYQLLHDLRDHQLVQSAHIFGEDIHISSSQINESEIVKALQSKGHSDVLLKQIDPSIEDVFIKLLMHAENHEQHN